MSNNTKDLSDLREKKKYEYFGRLLTEFPFSSRDRYNKTETGGRGEEERRWSRFLPPKKRILSRETMKPARIVNKNGERNRISGVNRIYWIFFEKGKRRCKKRITRFRKWILPTELSARGTSKRNLPPVKPAFLKEDILSPWLGISFALIRVCISRGSMLIVARFAFIARQ